MDILLYLLDKLTVDETRYTNWTIFDPFPLVWSKDPLVSTFESIRSRGLLGYIG